MTEIAAGRRQSSKITGKSASTGLSLAVAAFLLIVVSMGGLAVYFVSREANAARQSSAAVAQTYAAISQVWEILSLMQDAELGQRGFLITGNADFLQPYQRAITLLPKAIGDLRLSIVNDPAQAQRLGNIEQSVGLAMDNISRLVDARRGEAEWQQMQDLVLEGKSLLDRVRGLIAAMIAEEERLLALREADNMKRSAASERTTLYILTGLILLIAAVSMLMVRRFTLQKNAELALADSKRLQDAAFENMAQGIAVFDKDLRLIARNERFRAMLDLPTELTELGASLTDIIEFNIQRGDYGQEDPEVLRERFMDHSLRRSAYVFERTRPNGVTLEVRSQVTADGTLIRTFTDISDRRAADRAIQETATRLKTTLDSVLDAIITINESGSIESFSAGAAATFGYMPDEVLGRNVNMLMAEPYRSSHDGYLRHFLDSNRRHLSGRRLEAEARHKDGRIFPVDVTISEMQLGSRRMMIGVIRDVTERRAAERMKSEFVSTVSHELRTPLTSVAGSLGLLAGGAAGNLPERAGRLIAIARSNCERLVRLINDILDMEKIESGKMEFRFAPRPLRALVESAIEQLRGYADEFGVELKLASEGDDVTIYCDPDRLTQVFINLIANATKFSPRGGNVTIAIENFHHTVRLSVSDRGPGIASEFRERIFERFAQADSSDARQKGGTGLGLSIVKSIVQRHGGNVGFESIPGQGSTFFIELPIWREGITSILSSDIVRPLQRILICEDDRDIAEVLATALGDLNVHIDVSYSAEEAERLLESNEYVALILDLLLPGKDGLAFAHQIRSDRRLSTLPIIVVSAKAQEGKQMPQVESLGVIDWLSKPVDTDRLVLLVRSALHGPGKRPRILHVDDDSDVIAVVNLALRDIAEVIATRTAAAASYLLRSQRFDLVILDLSLPDGSGAELLSGPLSERPDDTPVIIFSAEDASADIVRQVETALTKSRASVEHLVAAIKNIIARRAISEMAAKATQP